MVVDHLTNRSYNKLKNERDRLRAKIEELERERAGKSESEEHVEIKAEVHPSIKRYLEAIGQGDIGEGLLKAVRSLAQSFEIVDFYKDDKFEERGFLFQSDVDKLIIKGEGDANKGMKIIIDSHEQRDGKSSFLEEQKHIKCMLVEREARRKAEKSGI